MTDYPAPETRPRVLDALLGELDDQTRKAYGLPPLGEGRRSGRMGSDHRIAAEPASGPAIAHPDLSLGGVIEIVKGTIRQVSEDRVPAVAAGVTFFGLLSLFPAITALVSIYALMADPGTINRHTEMLSRLMPPSALDIIREQIETIASAPPDALSMTGIVSLMVALYSANGGMKALLSGLNVAFYQKETRGFLRLNLIAMAFTLSALLLIALMMVAIAVIPVVLAWMPFPEASARLISALRWPVMFVVLILALAALYRWGPSRPMLRWRWISPGAVVAAIGFVASSYAFSWYATNFANYNETYGSLGAVILLMMWLWINAMVVLVGAELNAELERRDRLRHTTDPARGAA